MKALSIVRPAGKNIATGRKIVEIRSWLPPVVPLRDLLIVENGRRLEQEGDTDADGMAVAVIDITGAHPWSPEEALRDGHRHVAGYHAWVIENVRPIASPFPAIAARGIYEVDVLLDIV